MPKIRVLKVIHSLTGGGAERVVVDLLNHFDRAEFELGIATFDDSASESRRLPEGVRCFALPAFKRNLPFGPQLWQWRQVLRSFTPQVIHTHTTLVNRRVLRVHALSRCRVPLVVSEHSNVRATLAATGARLRGGPALLEMRLLYRRASAITAVSEGLSREIAGITGKKSRLLAVRNPLDRAAILRSLPHPPVLPSKRRRNTNHQLRMVAVGRLVKHKRFGDLIEALELIQRRVPARLSILGNGPQQHELEHQASRLGLLDRLDLPGFLDPPWPVMAESDIFVSASSFEGFGLAILEAMACLTPVVSTDCDHGPREFIEHGANGLLVPVGEPERLASAVLSLAADPDLADRLATAASQTVMEFSPAAVAGSYADIYQSVLGSGNDNLFSKSNVKTPGWGDAE